MRTTIDKKYSCLQFDLPRDDAGEGLKIQDFIVAIQAIRLAHTADENEPSINIFEFYQNKSKQKTVQLQLGPEMTLQEVLDEAKQCDQNQTNTKTAKQGDAIVAVTEETISDEKLSRIFEQNNIADDSGVMFTLNTSTNMQAVSFNPDQYTDSFINNLVEHIKKIAELLHDQPHLMLKEVQILAQPEWSKIIVDWNKTEAVFLETLSIPEVFANIVKQNPQRTALSQGAYKVSYQELDQASSKIAQFFTDVIPHKKGDIVAVYLERSPNVFMCTVGLLKAGLAYLPLHLQNPPERIQMILQDAGVTTLITQEKFLPLLGQLQNANIQLLTIETLLTQDEQPSFLPIKIDCKSVAYVIYTSGTTGQPKGIQIGHQGVCNLASHVYKDFGVRADIKVLQFASLGFDASVYEWAGALLNGAELCILSEDDLPPKGDLSDYIRKNQINFALLPPPILESLDSTNLESLSTLISGGEACTQTIVNKWAPGRTLYNAYGPSEATVACSFSHCLPKQRITIGKPIQNVKLYVLNQFKQPVPVGIPGELYIGGTGLGIGYLNRPELNASKFIPNPFGQPNERLYRTGDRVQWTEKGELEYIERIDSQVKLEGYRIELGEIESVLTNHPDVENCTVLLHYIDEFHKQLVAFYVSKRDGKDFSKQNLDEYARRFLPRYMIPARYVQVDCFPLTPSNKIDQKSLLQLIESNEASLDLKTLLEETWKNLLNTGDTLGNFFSLGGDSIRAIQFVATLRKHGYQMNSKLLYQKPTLSELLQILEMQTSKIKQIRINQQPAVGDIPLTPIQKWFFEQDMPQIHQWNQAFLFRTENPLNANLVQTAWKHLIHHHETLRIRYERNAKGFKQYFADASLTQKFLFKEIKTPGIAKINQDWITDQCLTLQNSLNIETGPILAVGLFHNHPDGAQRVLFAIHHLLIDGVSWRILLEDFFSLYQQLENGAKLTLHNKTDHYGTWAKALESFAQKDETQKQMNYWREIAGECSGKKVQQKYSLKDQKHHSLTLSEETTTGLLQDLPAYYQLNMNDILLAGLSFAFGKDQSNPKFFIDLEGHGREECIEDVDVTRTLGWFTTIFPVALELPRSFQKDMDSHWENLISLVKQRLDSIPDKGIGYGLLRYLTNDINNAELSKIRSEILFNYLGHFDILPRDNNKWEFAPESPGNPLGTDYFGKENNSLYPLEINALVVANRLSINLNYSPERFSEETIRKLANDYEFALKTILAYGKQLKFESLAPRMQTLNLAEDQPYRPFSLVNLQEYRSHIKDMTLLEDVHPTSFLQARMLKEFQQSNDGTHHIVSNFSIEAPYNKGKLLTVMQQLSKKHELLRAAFVTNDQEHWITLVYKQSNIDLQYYENQQSTKLIESEKLQTFDYEKLGMFRLLVNDFGSHFDLIFSFHNALEDGWSMATFVNEFSQAYIKDRKPQIQNGLKYAQLVRNELQALEDRETLNFWKDYLLDAQPTQITLKEANNTLSNHFFIIEADQAKQIHAIAQAHRMSVDIPFLVTYLQTVTQFCQKDDITIGLSTNNRLEIEGGDEMFGQFINIIPFRENLKKYLEAQDQLLGVFQNKLDVLKYKSLPYDYLKTLYQRELYEFVFDFVHLHILNQRLPEVRSTEGHERTHIPFTLTVAQRGNDFFGLSITAQKGYSKTEFLEDFASQYQKNLRLLLRKIHPQKLTRAS